MRIGLAGIDSSHADDFVRHFNHEQRHHDAAVTAFWGGGDARAAALVASSPELHAADSLRELIANVDAVIVGDRHGDLHMPHALPAIAAGKPVFVDKPLACNLSDATAIVDAAKQAGVWRAVHENFRFQAPLRAVRKVIDSGAIGDPSWARITFRTGFDVYKTQP